MSVIDEDEVSRTAGVTVPAPERTLPWWGFGPANMAVVFALSVLSWWLLVDPQWSPLRSYPQPYTAILFWTILGTMWVGFTFEWLGPASLRQPWRGLVGMAITLAIGVGITLVLAYGWGALDPAFAASREGGAGFTTGNLIVLFGFFFYAFSAINAGNWPWSAKTKQPWTGFGNLTLVLVPSILLYLLLALPNLAVWAKPGHSLMSMPTVIGWFYSVIVSAVITGLLAENRPWRFAGRPGRIVAFALVGNFVLGTVLYFLLLSVAKLVIGPDNVAALGSAVTSHAAELGVCWAVWVIAWPNVFGNKPTKMSAAVNVTVRVVTTFVLAVATYALYFFVLARYVLHEPSAGGTLYGDALGFMDWVVQWLLWYVLFLGSFGLRKLRTEPAVE